MLACSHPLYTCEIGITSAVWQEVQSPGGAWRLYEGGWGFLDALRKAQGAMPSLQTPRESSDGFEEDAGVDPSPTCCVVCPFQRRSRSCRESAWSANPYLHIEGSALRVSAAGHAFD